MLQDLHQIDRAKSSTNARSRAATSHRHKTHPPGSCSGSHGLTTSVAERSWRAEALYWSRSLRQGACERPVVQTDSRTRCPHRRCLIDSAEILAFANGQTLAQQTAFGD